MPVTEHKEIQCFIHQNKNTQTTRHRSLYKSLQNLSIFSLVKNTIIQGKELHIKIKTLMLWEILHKISCFTRKSTTEANSQLLHTTHSTCSSLSILVTENRNQTSFNTLLSYLKQSFKLHTNSENNLP